jgi:hypothetical protein
VDTGHNFPETIEFRDKLVAELGLELIVRNVQDSIDQGKVREERGRYASRNTLQTTTLLDAIEEFKFDACIGGARRDEEKARAKEQYRKQADKILAEGTLYQRLNLLFSDVILDNLYNIDLLTKEERAFILSIQRNTRQNNYYYKQFVLFETFKYVYGLFKEEVTTFKELKADFTYWSYISCITDLDSPENLKELLEKGVNMLVLIGIINEAPPAIIESSNLIKEGLLAMEALAKDMKNKVLTRFVNEININFENDYITIRNSLKIIQANTKKQTVVKLQKVILPEWKNIIVEEYLETLESIKQGFINKYR